MMSIKPIESTPSSVSGRKKGTTLASLISKGYEIQRTEGEVLETVLIGKIPFSLLWKSSHKEVPATKTATDYRYTIGSCLLQDDFEIDFEVAVDSASSGVHEEGEHTICYAYRSSPKAEQLGMGLSGCHVVETKHLIKGYPSLQVALDAAKAAGTAPTRWSIDHPKNSHLTA
jgi:hypothetical protein